MARELRSDEEVGVSEPQNAGRVAEMAESPQGPSPNQNAAGQGVSLTVVRAVLIVLAFAAGWFGNVYHNLQVFDQQIPPSMRPYAAEIFQTWRVVDGRYYDPSAINHAKMADAFISGIVNSLGDTGHSRFETKAEYQQEQNQLQNKPTVGIGVLLSGGGAQPLRIDEVFPGAPADRLLKSGDVILAVDGKSVAGLTIDQVHPLIAGSGVAGTRVTLTIQRSGLAQPLDVTLTRAQFTVPLISTYVIPGANLADIQLSGFGDGTDDALRTALKQAEAQRVNGIILDLRGNPGGFLEQGVQVASEFIATGSGHNVYIDHTRSSQQPVSVESGHQLATSLPLVILVDGNTASAAEIVTAAIAYNRPTVHVVGQRTFGTDTILTPFVLQDGDVVLLGTQQWLTPAGGNLRNGLQPDQPVALPAGAAEISPAQASAQQLTAAQLLAGQDTQLQRAIKDLTH
jgi:carboxyl-terminal processing protease